MTSKLAEPERQSLRQYLREQVDPAEVWLALKAALESGSQTAVVSAARLLATELYEERPDADRQADRQRATAQAKARLAELIAARDPDPAATLDDEAVREHPDLIVGDVSSARAAAVLERLAARGLVVPGHKVEERAEQIAQERLVALKAEHGLAG